MTDSVRFVDRDSGDPAWLGVRVEGDHIGLASSRQSGGELELVLGRSEAVALRDALTRALDLVGP